jgi:hypothetical protein
MAEDIIFEEKGEVGETEWEPKDEVTSVPEEEVEEEPVEFLPVPEGTEIVEEDTISEEQAEKLFQEVQSGRRYFEAPGIGRAYLRNPTVEETQEAGFIYSKDFNKAVINGIETQEVLTKQLVDKGILEDVSKPDAEVNNLRRELVKKEALLAKYDKNNKSKQAKKIATDLADTRDAIFDIELKRREYLSNSAESKAEDSRNNFLISRIAFSAEDDERIWPTYRDFLNETNLALVATVTYEFITFSYGLSSNYMFEFPEVPFLEDT